MIKFFRKIRQNMIKENKASKYLLYAIGEIILVIIGILIALNLNNKSEQRKSEAKIDVLFEKVLVELTDNIYETNRLIEFSKHIDTLGYLIAHNRLTDDDYTNPKRDTLGNLLIRELYFPNTSNLANENTRNDVVFLNTSAYDNLLLNMDAIPAKYDDVVSELNIMYTLDKNAIDIANVDLGDFVKNIKAERRIKYNWYSLSIFRPRKNKGMIDYMQNNYLYKNEVQGYWDLSKSQLNMTLGFRFRSIKIYQELALLLNKPTPHDSFKVNQKAVTSLTGIYKSISENGQGHLETYKLENNHMMGYHSADFANDWDRTVTQNTVIDFNKTKSKTIILMLRNNGVYHTYIVEGDTLTVLNNNNDSWEFVKVK